MYGNAPCPPKIGTNSNDYISYMVYLISRTFLIYERTICKNVRQISNNFVVPNARYGALNRRNKKRRFQAANSMRAPRDLVNWLDMT